MSSNSQDIRRAILAKWHESLSKYGNLFSSDSLSGTSPPSVFVGSYNYPKVFVGPMVPQFMVTQVYLTVLRNGKANPLRKL